MQHDVCAVFNRFHDALNLVREPDIVLIAQEDYIPRTVENSVFKISAYTLARALDISDAPVVCRIEFDRRAGLARGVIVADDYLVVPAELREYGFDLFSYIFLAVICGKSKPIFSYINRALRPQGCGRRP